jgi:hypothetical protein
LRGSSARPWPYWQGIAQKCVASVSATARATPLRQAVADCLTGAPRLNDALTPQDCQMLRHQRLLQIKVGCESRQRIDLPQSAGRRS